ncbi:MAG: DUF1080 domain-containing protein [Chitinophagaceae bacterium]|nr:DUF1080 domain-containing protein [Chitinophagaceae bacterium]
MKKIILSGFALSVLALSNVNAQTKDNELSATEKKAGWKLLFDGATTNGWHSYGKTALGEAWNVQDGTLHLGQHEGEEAGGDATTADEYGDFELKLDWKISPNGNSGVIFLVNESPEYERSYLTGPEMQVLDNNGHPDAKIIKHRAGDLYDLITSKPENVKPAGEWNSITIKLKNGKLELWQNGANVVSTTIGDEAWNTLVAGSKFKNMAAFAKAKQGHIVLQDHGNEVWYKNIKIRKL